jgi:hypothetical protein
LRLQPSVPGPFNLTARSRSLAVSRLVDLTGPRAPHMMQAIVATAPNGEISLASLSKTTDWDDVSLVRFEVEQSPPQESLSNFSPAGCAGCFCTIDSDTRPELRGPAHEHCLRPPAEVGCGHSRPAIAGADVPSICLVRSISSIGLVLKNRLNSRLN